MINAKGLQEIREFLVANHKNGQAYSDDLPAVTQMLNGWAQDAERQMDNGNPPSIELKAWDSVTGHTIEFTISDAGVDVDDPYGIEEARERVGAWKARREGSIDDPVAAAVYALDERYPGGWGIETFMACVEMIEEGVSPSLAADEA